MLSFSPRNFIVPAIIASFAVPPAFADNISLAPSDGELRMRGVIQNVQPGNANFLLAVQSVTGPDGETHVFPNPRAKQIALAAECAIQRGESQGTVSDISSGLSVIVVGRNDGEGRTMPARLVRLGAKSDVNLSYVPVSTAYSAPDSGGGLLPALPGVGGANVTPSFPSPARTAGPKIDYDGVCNDKVVVPLVFPIAGRVSWSDTFLADRDGGQRRHHGQDLMASKMTPLVACFDGTVSLSPGNSPIIYLKGDNGWSASYIHVNNDTPGTDDGKGGDRYAFAQGLTSGMHVRAGQLIGYVGDSGNAENTGPHCHFELHKNGAVFNAAPSLRNAQRLTAARPALPGTAQYAQSSLPPVSPQTTPNTGIASPFTAMETEIILAINKQREKVGLHPLSIRPELMQAARLHSNDMALRSKLEHTGADGSTPGQRARANGYTEYTLLGENVAMNGGYDKPGVEAVIGWMKSEGHRSNILNADFVETGVGIAKKGNLYYFTQVFANPGTGANAGKGIIPTEPLPVEETVTATHAMPPVSPKPAAPTGESDLSGIEDLTPEVATDAPATPDRTARLLELINFTRRERKLSELKLSTRLSAAAQAGSVALAHDSRVHRAGTNLSQPLDRRLRDARYPATATVRENLTLGTDDADRLMSLWMLRGGPARLNLLSPNITEIGIGYSTEASTDGPIHAWNVLFSNQPQ